MKKILFLFLPVALLAAACNTQTPPGQSANGAYVVIGGQKVNVELAVTAAEHERGLMFRETLAEDSGMLFIFDSSHIYPFWMKNTYIPLDIIWIRDNTIVDIKPDLPPGEGDSPPVYTPGSAANYVLEVNAGFTQRYNVQKGDKVDIVLPRSAAE